MLFCYQILTFNLPTKYDCGGFVPGNEYDNLTLDVSGTTYTASINGFLLLHFGYSEIGYSRIDFNDYTNIFLAFNGTSQQNNSYFIPLRKGQTITYSYSNCKPSTCAFIYTKGQSSIIKY